MKTHSDERTAVLWKSCNVDVGNGLYMICMYYYQTISGQYGKGLYKCAIRIDSKEGWESLRETLHMDNPAAPYLNSSVGIDDDLMLHYSGHVMTRADMWRWFGQKFNTKKIWSLKKFSTEEFRRSDHFLRDYVIDGNRVDILDVERIPRGKWFTSIKEKAPRKKREIRVIH